MENKLLNAKVGGVANLRVNMYRLCACFTKYGSKIMRAVVPSFSSTFDGGPDV